MNPELLRQGLYLTLGMSAAAPVTHAWSCWNSAQFSRYPALSVGLSLAAILNAFLLAAYKGSPDAIAFAVPGVLYLMYLWFPAGDFTSAENAVRTGDPFNIDLPELELPAVVVVNSGTREPFSRLELRALETVVYELSLAKISLIAVCADRSDRLADLKVHQAITYPVHADPDLAICRVLGCSAGSGLIPAFFYIDSNRTVRLVRYSGHICERTGPEAMVMLLEKNAGIVFPPMDEASTETGPAGS